MFKRSKYIGLQIISLDCTIFRGQVLNSGYLYNKESFSKANIYLEALDNTCIITSYIPRSLSQHLVVSKCSFDTMTQDNTEPEPPQTEQQWVAWKH